MDRIVTGQRMDWNLTTMVKGVVSRRGRVDGIVNSLARQVDIKVHESGSHNGRMTEFVRILVSILRNHPRPGYELTGQEAMDITNAVKLHDLGKLAISSDILLKQGRLTDEEFECIKRHPSIGVYMLNALEKQLGESTLLDVAREIAGCHHERWNGQGYPARLSGEEIPLSARIVALADVYDALAHDRPYRRAYTHAEAMDIIINKSPGHFDPYLVQILYENDRAFDDSDASVAS